MDIVPIGHCCMSSRFIYYLTFNLFIFVSAEMDSSNTSSLHLYRDFWLVQMRDLYLSPCSHHFADILMAAHAFASIRTLLFIISVAIVYYYIILPMNYVKVSH